MHMSLVTMSSLAGTVLNVERGVDHLTTFFVGLGPPSDGFYKGIFY